MNDVFTYWSLNPPAKWQAGSVGADRTPIYFSCADCGEKDALIGGILSTDGSYAGIGILKASTIGFFNPAMFCDPCYRARIDAAEAIARLKARQEDDEDNEPIDDETGQRLR